jgi:biotin carboxylase
MRLKAKSAGIPVPEFTAVFNDAMIHEFIRTVPAPWMLKPRGEASATGIKKINHSNELWDKLKELGDDRHLYLLERFIHGQVYHMDSIVQHGMVDFVRCSQYLAPPFEVAHGGGIFRSVTLDQSSEDNKALEKLNQQIISGFNLQYSATHAEALKNSEDGTFYFIETSARVGGAHIAEMVEYATGVNLWEEWARVEYANAANQNYKAAISHSTQAGILISLTKNEKADYSKFNDPEIVWKMNDLDHHIGIIAISSHRGKVLELMDKYAHLVQEEYHAAAPAPDKPIH